MCPPKPRERCAVTGLQRVLNRRRAGELQRAYLCLLEQPAVLAPRGAKRRFEARVRPRALVRGGVAPESPGRGDERQDEENDRADEAETESKRGRRAVCPRERASRSPHDPRCYGLPFPWPFPPPADWPPPCVASSLSSPCPLLPWL